MSDRTDVTGDGLAIQVISGPKTYKLLEPGGGRDDARGMSKKMLNDCQKDARQVGLEFEKLWKRVADTITLPAQRVGLATDLDGAIPHLRSFQKALEDFHASTAKVEKYVSDVLQKMSPTIKTLSDAAETSTG
jgi:hypothetical protein